MGLGGFALRAAMASASMRSYVRIGSVPRSPAGSKVVGSTAGSTQIQATVTLNPQDPAALAAYATDVSTPGSSVYHQYLTVSQFAKRFGATSSHVQAVESTLRAEGLKVGTVTKNDLSIPVTGTAAQLGTAFSTSFHSVALKGGRKAFANTSAPEFPASVAGYVQGVVGLSNLAVPHALGIPHGHALRPKSAHVKSDILRPNTAPDPDGGPQPTCSVLTSNNTNGDGLHSDDEVATAYGFSGLYGASDFGAGQTVAVYELEGNYPADIPEMESCYSLNGSSLSTSVTYQTVDGGPPAPVAGSDGVETELDIENVVGFAPKANVIVYQGPNGTNATTAGPYLTYSQIITQDIAQVITSSWGECEGDTDKADVNAENTLFQEAATQGQSVFAASGDLGSECDAPTTRTLYTDDPASQPYVTGTGATNLTNVGPPPTETVWNQFTSTNQGSNEASGGGISDFWTMPSYQSNAPDISASGRSASPCAANTGSTGDYCREVPDVTGNGGGTTGYLIYYGSGTSKDGWYAIGGTSAVAPLWAGFTALVNASSGCKGVPAGFLNPSLYSIAANEWTGTAYSADFYDVTSGDNNPLNYTTSGLPYSAGLGYDMTSGLGSMNGTQLATALCAPKAIGTVALPNSGTLPTGVVVDRTNHIAYVAESGSNTVAEITGTTASYFSNAATAVSSSILPSLNFPDDLALDSSGHVYASNFCVGTQAGICSSEASGTTAAVTQQTSASAGTADPITGGCSYPSGDAVFGTSTPVLFVSCAGASKVAMCNASGSTAPLCGTAATTLTLTGTAPVPSGMAAITTETTKPAVVVADAKNNTVSVVTDTSGTLAQSTPVSLATGCEPANVAIGPTVSSSASVYVACPGTGTVEVGSVSNASTPVLGTFTATSLPVPTGGSTPAPYGVAVNAAGTLLVVTDSANNDAVAYPSLSGASLGTGTIVPVGTTPDGVGIDGGNAFVANEVSNNVTVIDPATAKADHGHFLAARVRADIAHRPVSLTPLVAPLPSGKG
jgi:DNA-binding beta-propeller fold protein YncE